jgi:hypothetical protein
MRMREELAKIKLAKLLFHYLATQHVAGDAGGPAQAQGALTALDVAQ